jgi:hypothetical protein
VTRKKFRATEEQFRKSLLKWLSDKHQQLRANVHGDDDTSEWCEDEADLVEQHIQTVEGLIFVNDALKASTDEAHRQADLAYEASENLISGAEAVLEEWDRGDEAAFRKAIEEMRADVAAAKKGRP